MQCWKSCPNSSNIAALRFGDHRTNCWDLLVQMFDSFDFEQQFQTTRNNMQKQTAECTYGRDMLHPTMLGVAGLQCLHIVCWSCRLRALEKQAINSLCHSGGLPNICFTGKSFLSKSWSLARTRYSWLELFSILCTLFIWLSAQPQISACLE